MGLNKKSWINSQHLWPVSNCLAQNCGEISVKTPHIYREKYQHTDLLLFCTYLTVNVRLLWWIMVIPTALTPQYKVFPVLLSAFHWCLFFLKNWNLAYSSLFENREPALPFSWRRARAVCKLERLQLRESHTRTVRTTSAHTLLQIRFWLGFAFALHQPSM